MASKIKVVVEVRNGVQLEVVRGEADYPRGRIQFAECQCFGVVGRVHSSMYCPLLSAICAEGGARE